MWAVVVALTVMMWMWSAVSLHFSGWLERGANYPVRMAYLGVLIALGATALLSLLWLVLPGSTLSSGWTLKQLQNTQQLSVLCVALSGIAGLWRGSMLWSPERKPALSPNVIPAAAAKAAQKKRRP